MARVKSSVGSRKSLRSSTFAMANVSRHTSTTTFASTQSAGGAASLADVTIAASFLNRAAAEMREDVVECGFGAEAGLQFRGFSQRCNLAAVHQRQLIAKFVGFVHVVR